MGRGEELGLVKHVRRLTLEQADEAIDFIFTKRLSLCSLDRPILRDQRDYLLVRELVAHVASGIALAL